MKAFLNTEASPLIFQYSGLLWGCLLGASWVNECKAFHLVYVCQRQAWKPSPLNAVSAGPLIEPDQFAETASRLAQLPHQRDSNNSTMWPLLCLKKSHIYVCFKARMAVDGKRCSLLAPRFTHLTQPETRTDSNSHIQKYKHLNWALIRIQFCRQSGMQSNKLQKRTNYKLIFLRGICRTGFQSPFSIQKKHSSQAQSALWWVTFFLEYIMGCRQPCAWRGNLLRRSLMDTCKNIVPQKDH